MPVKTEFIMAYQETSILQLWTLTLLEELRRIRETIPALAKLPLPNLAIDPALTRTLGDWDEDKRLIRLSEDLILRGDFDDIIYVLKHELAHQIVSEVYHIKGAVAHGEAFKRACHLLGIPSDTRIELGEFKEQSRLQSRLRKLMAMGSSNNNHEAIENSMAFFIA